VNVAVNQIEYLDSLKKCSEASIRRQLVLRPIFSEIKTLEKFLPSKVTDSGVLFVCLV